MIKFIKKVNRKLDKLLYDATPKTSNLRDRFIFSNKEEEEGVYEECQNTRRSITSSNPFLKIYVVLMMIFILGFIGIAVYCLIV